MKVRFAEQQVRLRLNPDDLAALQSGEAVETKITAPGREGAAQGFCVRLCVDPESSDPSVQIDERRLLVRLRDQDLEYMAEPGHEGVVFAQEVAGAADLQCAVEKDVHSFARVGVEIPRKRARVRG